MKTESKATGIVKWFLLIVMTFFVAGSFFKVQMVKADDSIIKVTGCSAENSNSVVIKTVIKKNSYSTLQVYRAGSDGKFKLLDEAMTIGTSAWGVNGVWSFSGSQNTVDYYTDNFPITDGANVTFKDKTAKLGKKYYYKIVLKPGDDSVPGVTSQVVSATVDLSVPDIRKSLSTDGKSVKIVWDYSGKAKGYQVYRYDAKKKKWKSCKTLKKTKNTFTDKNVKTGKSYKYKVRAYATVNGKKIYSKFSSVHTVSLKKPTVKGNYKSGSVYGPYLNNNELMQVRRAVQSFKTNYIRKGMSDYEKVWAAFRFLRSNCSYAVRGWQYNNANTAWGALVYGEAQCSGYARAMKALCDGIGVKCYYVHANSKASNPNHQWNEVKVDGKWYIVDAQSGFFLVGSKTWKNEAGMRWNTNGLPKCSTGNHKKAGLY